MKVFYFLLILAVIALAGFCFLGTTATAADSSPPPAVWLAVSAPNAVAQGGCGSCLFISTDQNSRTTVTSRAAPLAIPEEKQNLYFVLTKDHMDKGA